MSAYRKVVGGAALVTALTIAGAGLSSLSVGAQEAGSEEAVDPSIATTVTVAGSGTPIATTTTTAKATTTTAVAGAAGAAATTSTAAPTTTKAPIPGAGAPATTVGAEVEAANENQLPVTGSDIGAPLKLGVALGALGLGALLIARRRRPAAV